MVAVVVKKSSKSWMIGLCEQPPATLESQVLPAAGDAQKGRQGSKPLKAPTEATKLHFSILQQLKVNDRLSDSSKLPQDLLWQIR